MGLLPLNTAERVVDSYPKKLKDNYWFLNQEETGIFIAEEASDTSGARPV